MTNAQQWLDKKYPLEKRKDVKEIGNDQGNFSGMISSIFNGVPDNLTGLFTSFQGFDNLTKLCLGERKLDVNSIYTFPNSLEFLQLANNSFPESTLEPFSHLINLKVLDIGSAEPISITPSFLSDMIGGHNKWYGSLEPLKNLNKLKSICLATTDVSGGLEYLSNTVKHIGCISDVNGKKCLELKKVWEQFYNIEIYKMYLTNSVNFIRLKEIFETLENNPRLPKHVKNNIPLLKLKMFNLINEEANKVNEQNNLLSNELISVNKDLEHYKNSQEQETAKLRSNLPLLMNSLNNASNNNALLSVANIEQLRLTIIGLETKNNNQNYELTKLINLVEECKKTIIENNEKIKELTTWKEASLSKLKNLEVIKDTLATKRKELSESKKEISILKKKVSSLDWKINYANSKLNFCLGINTLGRQTVGRLPYIGKYAMVASDALQGTMLGTRSFISNDSYLESGIWLTILSGLIAIIYCLVPFIKWFITSSSISLFKTFSNFKEAVQPPKQNEKTTKEKEIIDIEDIQKLIEELKKK